MTRVDENFRNLVDLHVTSKVLRGDGYYVRMTQGTMGFTLTVSCPVCLHESLLVKSL